jgi:hypothetical protein
MIAHVVPEPLAVELDAASVPVSPEIAWEAVRGFDLTASPLVAALIGPGPLRLDDLHVLSSGDRQRVLGIEAPGWDLLFFAVRVEPHDGGSRVVIDTRVADGPDTVARIERWTTIAPFVRVIRRDVLRRVTAALGAPGDADRIGLPGDERLAEAAVQLTESIDLASPPDAAWALLLGHPAQEDPRWRVISADAPRALVLEADAELRTEAPTRPESADRPWRATVALVVEPRGAGSRVRARMRVAFDPARLRALIEGVDVPWHGLLHPLGLQDLAIREAPPVADPPGVVAEGVSGAARMVVAFLSPWMRAAREHWGLSPELAGREYPGDELVPHPRWQWTHGIEIDAPVERVWPWVAQIGTERGGFYSYQFLENVIGCRLRTADVVHAEWQDIGPGSVVHLHPSIAMPVVAAEPGRWFVANGHDEHLAGHERRYVNVSWLFFVEPLDGGRSRFVSRFRTDYDETLSLPMGPLFIEPVGYVMDRRMLLGLKERAER